MYSIELAKETVEKFVQRFSDSYRLLTYYAALPVILTPELLNYLRNRFLQGKVPWVAEADLLLSNLCRPVGYEQYVMDATVRTYLLMEARRYLSVNRMREVASLLIHYVRYISRTNPYISEQELQTQQWAAMLYLEDHRENAVREIAQSINSCIDINDNAEVSGLGIHKVELARLIRITQTLTVELKEYPELLEYAKCVTHILSGTATENVFDRSILNQPVSILGIDLPAPNLLKTQGTSDFDFGAMLDQYEQEQAQYQEGAVVRGTVVGVTERSVIIDFGFKFEGAVPIEEFEEAGELTVKRGDEVEVLIKSMESQDGSPILTRADIVRKRAWDELEKAYRDGTPVKGKIAERVKGGLRVDVDGVAAFLPGSQVDVRPIRNLESLRGQEIEAKVIKLNRKRSSVVLSRKAILEEENQGKKGETLNALEEGIIVEGQIKNLTDYGAFVDLGGIDGLLHVTDMSWGRLLNPGEMFKVGESVQVKVLKFDKERERVTLGYKQLLPDPWESVSERFPTGQRMQGKIASVTDYGAFIELEPGVEGLVHVSEMTWSKRMKHPSKVVSVGQQVDVEVTNIDIDNRRLSLSIKDIEPKNNPDPINQPIRETTGNDDSVLDRESASDSIDEPVQFYSCFISYSSGDEEFAKRLHARLQEEGIRVWFAPEDITGGVGLSEQIDSAIQLHDRLLLILSENSLQSRWVEIEIRRARKTEIKENRRKIFPVRIVDYETLRGWSCVDAQTGEDLASAIREYFIPDFTNWKDPDSFESAFSRLLRDLKAERA